MMELREQIARAINGRRTRPDDVSWSDWLPEADAVIEVLMQQKPVARVVRNMSGQIRLEDAQGGSFDLLSRLGANLYIAPSAQEAHGWLRAVDEEMVTTHLGVANAGDDYYEAKEKLNQLITWHVQVALDPAVNGGYKLIKQSGFDTLPDDYETGDF